MIEPFGYMKICWKGIHEITYNNAKIGKDNQCQPIWIEIGLSVLGIADKLPIKPYKKAGNSNRCQLDFIKTNFVCKIEYQ